MQHTVCENLLEVDLNEGIDLCPQQVSSVPNEPLDNPLDKPLDKPRLALRDKSDCSRKMRLTIPLVMPPTTVGRDVITKRKLPARTRKKPQTSVRPSRIGNSTNNVPTIIGKRLLNDIIAIMMEKKLSKMRSNHLLVYLCANLKKPWATFCRGGKSLNFRQLSALLKEFGICSKDMRFKKKSYKGYQKEWFVEARRSAKARKK